MHHQSLTWNTTEKGLSENRILSILVYHHVPHENCPFFWCMVYPISNPIFKQTPRVHLSSQGHGLKFQDGYRLTTPVRSSWDQRSACVWCWPWWQSWQRSSCNLPAAWKPSSVHWGKSWPFSWENDDEPNFWGHWILGCLILMSSYDFVDKKLGVFWMKLGKYIYICKIGNTSG